MLGSGPVSEVKRHRQYSHSHEPATSRNCSRSGGFRAIAIGAVLLCGIDVLQTGALSQLGPGQPTL